MISITLYELLLRAWIPKSSQWETAQTNWGMSSISSATHLNASKTTVTCHYLYWARPVALLQWWILNFSIRLMRINFSWTWNDGWIKWEAVNVYRSNAHVENMWKQKEIGKKKRMRRVLSLRMQLANMRTINQQVMRHTSCRQPCRSIDTWTLRIINHRNCSITDIFFHFFLSSTSTCRTGVNQFL